MNIAILGAGKIGGALAQAWSGKGHRIFLGVKDPITFGTDSPLTKLAGVTAHTVGEAAEAADLIVISVPAKAVIDVAHALGTVQDKLIIDTTNGPLGSADYLNAVTALRAITGCADVVKCFNSTGFENLINPVYQNEAVDMFMAGSSPKAKETTRLLTLELGFANCYDLGDDSKIGLVEQLAQVWMTLAFGAKLGRNIALKVVKR
ncbi:MAG: NAD(P)-binding domain-containing protein [Spirosoma sp.]|nr:NAD(P)-binding domain-containing protein [Spirosoma sp.]